MKSSATVTKDYLTLNPDSLVIHSGEELEVGQSDEQWLEFVWCTTKSGKSGWVPLDFIDRHGNTGIARCNYSAAELNVSTG